VPIVLISYYRFDREKRPHWVTVTACDERFVYVHDPYVDTATLKCAADCTNVPIPRAEFGRMSRYGKARLKAAVVISRREKGP
jgi:hypothetical protein